MIVAGARDLLEDRRWIVSMGTTFFGFQGAATRARKSMSFFDWMIVSCDNQVSAAVFSGGGVDPIPCVSTHRISDPRSGPAQLLPPHVKQRNHPHRVRPQIPDR